MSLMVLVPKMTPTTLKTKLPNRTPDRVTYYRWQIVDKNITKARIEISFNNAIEMFKEEVAVLKEHIHIKSRQINAYSEIRDLL